MNNFQKFRGQAMVLLALARMEGKQAKQEIEDKWRKECARIGTLEFCKGVETGRTEREKEILGMIEEGFRIHNTEEEQEELLTDLYLYITSKIKEIKE